MSDYLDKKLEPDWSDKNTDTKQREQLPVSIWCPEDCKVGHRNTEEMTEMMLNTVFAGDSILPGVCTKHKMGSQLFFLFGHYATVQCLCFFFQNNNLFIWVAERVWETRRTPIHLLIQMPAMTLGWKQRLDWIQPFHMISNYLNLWCLTAYPSSLHYKETEVRIQSREWIRNSTVECKCYSLLLC